MGHDHTQPCLYGGLFLLLYHPEAEKDPLYAITTNPYLEILCLSIKSKIVLPYQTSSSMRMVFFKNYSRGTVSAA